MNKLFSLFVALFVTTTLWAYTFQSGDLYYDVTGSKPYTVSVTYQYYDVRYHGYEDLTTIIIPNTVTHDTITYRVTGIGINAFSGCSSLTSINIPNSVTFIGNGAFYGCSSLTSIDIPNSVTHIGGVAFFGCSSLASINIPNGVTSIETNVFSGCSSLTSINIPNSVTSIGNRAFYDCSSLTSINIPNSVTIIWNDTFYGCSSLTSIDIPNSVTHIGDRAFWGCSSLTSIDIPNSVTFIGVSAFSGCSSLTSINIPNSVTSIGSSAFYKCSALTSISIPNSVWRIENGAFSSCSSLASATIGNSVTSIGKRAFYDCSSLTSINIPNSVTGIGTEAFSGCSSLTSINIPNSVTSIGSSAFYKCSALTSIDIPNSVTSIGDKTFYGCSSLTSITIPNSVTTIGTEAFSGCSSLTSIDIPNSVTSIGGSAFSGCSFLTSVTVGNSVTSIGKWAFSGCRELKEIYCHPTTPPSVTARTFENYKATLYVPCDSKEAYEEHPVFGKFEKIRGIDGCGEYVTTHIYDTICQGEVYEFGGCLYDATGTYTSTIDLIPTYLYLTVLPSPTVTITVETNDSYIWHDEVYTESGEYKYVTVAANGCDSTEVLLLTIISSDEDEPNSPNKIYYTSSDENIVNSTNPNGFGANIISNTYENGQGIITFDGSITMVGDSAFCNCKSLTSITIPNTVKHIGEYAFRGCYDLAKTNFMGEIADWCDIKFGGAYANPMSASKNLYLNNQEVKDLVIPNTVDSIHAYAFDCGNSITSVALPNSVVYIGEGAFYRTYINEIIIPKSVTSIEERVLSGCNALTSIIVEDGNPVYDSRDNSNAIIETNSNTLIAGCATTDIPNTIMHIGPHAISYLSSLKAIEIPNSIITIGDYAFYACSSLKSITIPNRVSHIGYWALYACYSLNSIVVEEGNSVYDSRNNCNAIIETATNSLIVACQNTVIPEGVTNIRENAFFNCNALINSNALTSIVLPNTIESIEAFAFSMCSSLDTIYCYAITPPTTNQYAFENYDATLYVPCGSLEAYKAHEVWGRFNTIQCLEDPIPDPTERVLSCAEAVTVCLKTGTTATTEEYTIHGYVTEITTEYSEQYKNISFYMADTKDGGQVLFTYRIKPIYEADIAVKVGDFVEVVGKLVNYNGYLPEVYPGVYTIVNDPEMPMGTSDIQLPTSNTKKVVKAGQLLIIRDGVEYNALGVRL